MSSARERFNLAVASAFGLGLSPIAPGSFGALLGVAYHVAAVLALPPSFHVPALVVGLLITIVANHVLTPWAVAYWEDEDPRHFVLDEVAGYLVVPILFPRGDLVLVATLGFLLFRVFDVIKIPPARQIDRNLHGPWGIVLDDIISGAYAALALYALAYFGVIAG